MRGKIIVYLYTKIKIYYIIKFVLAPNTALAQPNVIYKVS